MKARTLTKTLQKALKTFPAIVLTGPRQSGKTTLLQAELSKTHQYISLEDPGTRLRIKEDPVSFIKSIQGSVILDEIQYLPELLSYIKDSIDRNRKAGKWILTGSQNFALMHGVTESLAGRSAILSLLPFSVSERVGNGAKSEPITKIFSRTQKIDRQKLINLPEIILRGNYPEIASNANIDRSLWCGSYITTYLERDVRNLEQVGDLGQFEIFLRACAVRTGQILDLSSLAREIGISFTTARRWLSLLETGYQIYLLRPYYRNIGKRLIKRPKLYFTDTGLASYLLGINDRQTLLPSPFFGPLFETLVIADFWKRFYHHGETPSMYFLRTQDDLEVDLVIENSRGLDLVEIKSSATIKPEHLTSLLRAKRDLKGKITGTAVISNANDDFPLPHDVTHLPVEAIFTN